MNMIQYMTRFVRAAGRIVLILSLLLGTPAWAVEACQVEGKPVRKQCDCVRKSSSGFPYIETRKAECRTYKDGTGKTCRVDCPNCYAICIESPPAS